MIASELQTAFMSFAVVAAVAAMVTVSFAVETKKKALEEVSP